MKKLVQEQQEAIRLRKYGLSYKEILKRVPVAKSTLSLWLKDLPLTDQEKQILKKRKNLNISRGRIKAASELRQRRLEREKEYFVQAKEIFELWKDEPRFHAGIVMYWAEGAKTDSRWMIINTDFEVITLMYDWLKDFLEVPESDIYFRLFIHKPYADGSCEDWWQKKLGVTLEQFLPTVYKPTKHEIKMKPGHQGCVRMEVNKSKKLFYQMKVLKRLAVEYYRKQ